MKIEISNDYKKFNFLTCNRPVLDLRVNRMIADDNFPETYKAFPILVDKDFGIIDGQHRFRACEKLGLPIYYIQSDEVNAEYIKYPNAHGKKWQQCDFINYYRNMGNKEYEYVAKIMQENNMPLSHLILINAGITSDSTVEMNKAFKEGNFKIENKALLEAAIEAVYGLITRIRTLHGYIITRMLFNHIYMFTLSEIWQTNRALFNRIKDRLPQHFHKLLAPRNKEDAILFLTKLSKYHNV